MTDATWLRAQLDRLDRNQAEMQKWSAEQRKLAAERQKLVDEQFAKSLNPNRDPCIIAIGAVVAAFVFRLPEILHAFGISH